MRPPFASLRQTIKMIKVQLLMRIFRTTPTWLLAVIGALALAGCDSNSSSRESSSSSQSSVTYSSVQASDFGNLQVHFPPPGSRVDADTITVRGTILDASEIATLSVDGNSVDAADYADWRVPVALQPGENVIVVEVIDADGNSSAQDLTVYRDQSPIQGTDLAKDPTTGTVYLLDGMQNRVFAYDGPDGAPTPVAQSGENLLSDTRHLIVDWTNNQLIVGQRHENAFVTIDMTSGEQTVRTLALEEERDLAPVPYDMVFDGTDLYLVYNETIKVDEEGNRLPQETEDPHATTSYAIYYRVNPVTWQATTLVEYHPDLEGVLYPVTAMTTNASEPYLYVGELRPTVGIPRLVTIDKESAEITRLDLQNSDGEAIFPLVSRDLLIDSTDQKLYQLVDNEIWSVELDGNLYESISTNTDPEDQPIQMFEVRRFVPGEGTSAIYFEDSTDQLINVNLEDGTRSLFGDTPAVEPYIAVRDLALDVRNQSLYALDAVKGAIFKHDLVDGTKSTVLTFDEFVSPTPIADPDNYDVRADRNNPISYPTLGAVSATGTLMVIDAFDAKLTSITPGDEGYTAKIEYRLGDNTFADLAVDDITGTFYLVRDRAIYTYYMGISQNTALRNFSGGLTPTKANPFETIRSLAVDKTNNRLLATDSSLDVIIAVDMQTGARSVFSELYASEDNNDPVLNQPSLIAVHNASEQALVVDTTAQGIFSINLQDGNNKQLWLDLKQSAPQGLTNPKSMTVHPFYHYALLFDDVSHRVIAVDIPTKQIVSLGR